MTGCDRCRITARRVYHVYDVNARHSYSEMVSSRDMSDDNIRPKVRPINYAPKKTSKTARRPPAGPYKTTKAESEPKASPPPAEPAEAPAEPAEAPGKAGRSGGGAAAREKIVSDMMRKFRVVQGGKSPWSGPQGLEVIFQIVDTLSYADVASIRGKLVGIDDAVKVGVIKRIAESETGAYYYIAFRILAELMLDWVDRRLAKRSRKRG